MIPILSSGVNTPKFVCLVALPLTCRVAQGKLLDLSEPVSSSVKWGFSEIMYHKS